jgi:hypothetical protein
MLRQLSTTEDTEDRIRRGRSADSSVVEIFSAAPSADPSAIFTRQFTIVESSHFL